MSVTTRTPARILACLFLALLLCSLFAVGASAAPADEGAEETPAEAAAEATTAKAFSAALVLGLPASLGALAMGFAIAKAVEGISRQPEAEGKIRGALMVGLVFVETLVIYALIAVILMIFVL
ncbi:MAG: ATP synthase F0 subunit C [Eubacteriales bacterium]